MAGRLTAAPVSPTDRGRHGTVVGAVLARGRDLACDGDMADGRGSFAGGPVTAEWRRWGPYVSERAWGTVREDYSADGRRVAVVPVRARPQPGVPLERGRPRRDLRRRPAPPAGVRLLERQRPDPQGADLRARRAAGQPRRGRQGAVVVPRLDARRTRGCAGPTCTRRRAFPYDELVAENARRGRLDDEYELWDTGVLDGGWWDIVVDYAKAAPDDWCIRRARPQRRRRRRRRCTSCRRCGSATRGAGAPPDRPTSPTLTASARQIDDGAPRLRPDGAHRRRPRRSPLACDNESNADAAVGRADGRRTPRTASATTSSTARPRSTPPAPARRARCGTGSTSRAGETVEIRLRFAPTARPIDDDVDSDDGRPRARRPTSSTARLAGGVDADEALVMRQAFAGMMWGKQFFHYDVERWLDGDPRQPRAADRALARGATTCGRTSTTTT